MYGKVTVGRSKTGLPTLTECGGGASNTGDARIIAGPVGERVTPLFVPRGHAQGDHAIFVLKVGMVILDGDHDRSGESIVGRRVKAIGTAEDPDEVGLEDVGSYANGDGDIPVEFDEAVAAVKEKMHCYHCRHAHYIL